MNANVRPQKPVFASATEDDHREGQTRIRFLLRNFCNGKKDQLWAYDKTSDRAFLTNAKNVASESRFYDFEVAGEPITLEPFLTNLEGKAKAVIDSILDADSLTGVADEGRAVMAAFLSVQLTRTRTLEKSGTRSHACCENTSRRLVMRWHLTPKQSNSCGTRLRMSQSNKPAGS